VSRSERDAVEVVSALCAWRTRLWARRVVDVDDESPRGYAALAARHGDVVRQLVLATDPGVH
jgi:hypothetical protein